MPRKEMDPELAEILAKHKPRGLTFPSSKPAPETLEEMFGKKEAARMRREAEARKRQDGDLDK